MALESHFPTFSSCLTTLFLSQDGWRYHPVKGGGNTAITWENTCCVILKFVRKRTRGSTGAAVTAAYISLVVSTTRLGSCMSNDKAQYEFKDVRAIRGVEDKTIAKWKEDGWELVSQEQGRLRTTLSFRRPKPKAPWRLIAALGGAGVLVAVVIAVGALQEDSSDASSTEVAASSSSEQPSEQPSEEAVQASDPPEPEVQEILTAGNNDDLAAILAEPDYCSDSIADFAAAYEGRTIQFNGRIDAMNNHGSYDTRYDILVGATDFRDAPTTGPAFQFRDVNITSDLRLTGSNIPDTLGVGDPLRVTAHVEEYEDSSCLFQLEPVSTEAL